MKNKPPVWPIVALDAETPDKKKKGKVLRDVTLTNNDLFGDFDSALDSYTSKPKGTLGSYNQPKCYHSHPVLKILAGELVGGSCLNPVCQDANVYIGLDSGMSFMGDKYPWDGADNPVQFLFKIRDGDPPKSASLFAKLVDWVVLQLSEGKKVHIGCIGGHGRTGTVFSAIICKALGEKDAITWVRKNYCTRAVESREQVDFLHEHYGIKKIIGSKEYKPSKGIKTESLGFSGDSPGSGNPTKSPMEGKYIGHIVSKGSIWRLDKR